tara:strand:+ start:87 stop:1151 length:1065 start_codon:yes stop_codon:yes gene_type:complete
MTSNIIKYLNFSPSLNNNNNISRKSWIIGNVGIKENTIIKDHVVLRGDGEKIKIGKDCIFYERSTVHVASDYLGSRVGDRCVIGRESVIHACILSHDVLVGDHAVIMDGSVVGNNSVVAADSLISPGKKFPPFSIIAGSPAKKIRSIDSLEYNELRLNYNKKNKNIFDSSNVFRKEDVFKKKPLIDIKEQKNIKKKNTFISPDAVLNIEFYIEDFASIWFGVKILSKSKKSSLSLGRGSNIQDNTIIFNQSKESVIGKRVTIGHNVVINGPIKIGNDAVIGMGSYIEHDCIIENDAFVAANSYLKKKTVVPKNKIFAGNPGIYFRDKSISEKKYFKSGQKIYEKLSKDYCQIFN